MPWQDFKDVEWREEPPRAEIPSGLHFDELWIPPEQLGQTGALAQSQGYLPHGEYVEIGAWQGLSTVTLANAVHPATLHVVDHWLGDSQEAIDAGTAINPELLARDNYGIFLSNMEAGTRGNYEVHKANWRDWVKGWTQDIRFLHLDGDHTTKEVRDCLEAIVPFMVPQGIIAGDDWDWPTVKEGVHLVFPPERIQTGFGKLWWVVCE